MAPRARRAPSGASPLLCLWLTAACAAAPVGEVAAPSLMPGARAPERCSRAEASRLAENARVVRVAPAAPEVPWDEVTWRSLPAALRHGPAYLVVYRRNHWTAHGAGLSPGLRAARAELRGFVRLLGVAISSPGSRDTLLAHYLLAFGFDAHSKEVQFNGWAVLFFSGRHNHRPALYDGPLLPRGLVPFAFAQRQPVLTKFRHGRAVNFFLRQHVAACVLCLPPTMSDASVQELLQEFMDAAVRARYGDRVGEGDYFFEPSRKLVFAFVRENKGGRHCSTPTLTVTSGDGFKRSVTGSALTHEYSISDWIRETALALLPEMTTQNSGQLMDIKGFVVAARFDHALRGRRGKVLAALAPLVFRYGQERGFRFVTQQGESHEEELVVTSTVHEAPQAFQRFLSDASALKRFNEWVKNVMSEPLPETHMVILPNAVSETEAAALVSTLPLDYKNMELDSVDGLPTYDVELPTLSVADCRHSRKNFPTVSEQACEAEKAFVARMLPKVRRAATLWGLGVPGRELEFCASFARRYVRGERRSIDAHEDKSVITINTVLNDPAEFVGGLVMYPPGMRGRPLYPERHPFSGIMYNGNITHGVKMQKGWRYSWITFWHHDCAETNSYQPAKTFQSP